MSPVFSTSFEFAVVFHIIPFFNFSANELRLLTQYFAKDNYTNVTSTDQLIVMFVGLFAVLCL